MKFEVDIKPFPVPDYVGLIITGQSNTKSKEPQTIHIKELSSEQLDELCRKFKIEAFKTAGKEMPAQPADRLANG